MLTLEIDFNKNKLFARTLNITLEFIDEGITFMMKGIRHNHAWTDVMALERRCKIATEGGGGGIWHEHYLILANTVEIELGREASKIKEVFHYILERIPNLEVRDTCYTDGRYNSDLSSIFQKDGMNWKVAFYLLFGKPEYDYSLSFKNTDTFTITDNNQETVMVTRQDIPREPWRCSCNYKHNSIFGHSTCVHIKAMYSYLGCIEEFGDQSHH